MHAIPEWRAIADPFHARSSDWAIVDPHLPIAPFSYADDHDTKALLTAAAKISTWWPREHFAPASPMAQLPDGQIAFLRRQTNVILATATDLAAPDLARRVADTVHATLLLTDQPDRVLNVAQASGTIGAPLVLYGGIDASPAIAAIEFPAGGPAGPPAGRTRFSIAPPPALSAMHAGDIAISDPVILRPPIGDAALPVETDALLARMVGSTRLARRARLGVYWETYGLAPTDSVEIAVWVERNTPQGILRRFGISLSVAVDLNTPVVQSWTESRLGRQAQVIAGAIPIVGRSIVLDASTLVPGDYWLDVVVRKAGGDPVRGRRAFTVASR
jgi:hypothetical protein